MHCETLLRLSIEEVNFRSVRKTNIALSVLKAKQLQWNTVKTGGYGWPQQNGENINGGVGTVNWVVTSLIPGNSYPGLKLYSRRPYYRDKMRNDNDKAISL